MKRGDAKLWLAVAGGFALLFGAWAILFTLVARNRVADVPLAPKITAPAPAVMVEKLGG